MVHDDVLALEDDLRVPARVVPARLGEDLTLVRHLLRRRRHRRVEVLDRDALTVRVQEEQVQDLRDVAHRGTPKRERLRESGGRGRRWVQPRTKFARPIDRPTSASARARRGGPGRKREAPAERAGRGAVARERSAKRRVRACVSEAEPRRRRRRCTCGSRRGRGRSSCRRRSLQRTEKRRERCRRFGSSPGAA